VRISVVGASLLGAALFTLTAVRPAQAQYPRARRGQFELRGLDFRARGAWRQRTANIRAQRQALLAAGNLAMLNARVPGLAPVVTGNFQLPVVPIHFSNTDTTALFLTSDTTALKDLFFSPAPVGRPYSVKTYYEQLSNGFITMAGRVFPWVRADSTDLYYEDGCNGIGVLNTCPNGGARLGAMLLGALAKVSNGADSSTVWARFDNDGPDGIPNSLDDDGVVDFVTFLQPEVDGACGNTNIWAHRFVIEGLNNGSPYVTKTVRPGGGRIVVSDYIIQSALGGNSGCTPGQIMPIGTVAHETGHAFGLPDLYDTSPINPSEGIGEWGLMGSGNGARPYSPSRMEAWSLAELGWVTVDTLRTTGTMTLNPVATSDTVRVLPTQTPGQYFLLENRAAVESDTAQMNPAFARPKAPGLVVWQIDQARISAGNFSNTVNTGSVQGVALVQADGLNQLRTPGAGNRGDVGDSYPGSTGNTALDGGTLPALRTNAGKVVAGRIDSIRIGAGQVVLFRYRVERLLQVTAVGSGTGTVTASEPGNPLDGLSLTPGTVVTVTAAPAAGHLFGGWTGDTVSSDSALVLTMNRNWVLTALFTFVAPFTTAAAASDLLGVPALSAAQRTVLDDQGNQNGIYDLGDFLAWTTLSGQGASPAVMARLLGAAQPPRKGAAP
jgi:M6 family metalloprotease-like protein